MKARSRRNERLDQRAKGRLLDISDQADRHRATALNHAENGRLVRRQGSPNSRPRQPPAPPVLARSAHRFRMALVSGKDVDFIALDSTPESTECADPGADLSQAEPEGTRRV